MKADFDLNPNDNSPRLDLSSYEPGWSVTFPLEDVESHFAGLKAPPGHNIVAMYVDTTSGRSAMVINVDLERRLCTVKIGEWKITRPS